EPRGFRVAPGSRAKGFLNELDQPRTIDELDRVRGDELLRGERKGACGDEESLVAARVVDGAQKLLEIGRADDAAGVILALDDRAQTTAVSAEVGTLITAAASPLHLIAHRLEQLRDEFFEALWSQFGKLLELQVGAACLVAEPFDALAAVA